MKSLKGKTVGELEAIVIENKKALLNLRFQKKLGNQVKVDMFRKLKRQIARVKTILNNNTETTQ
jgi:ribosomal protein L29